jgi:glycosyltransferase involved in cell wall biosynthesis
MWPITGKCAWAFECERFKDSCGQCPQLTAYPRATRDTSAFGLRLKRLLYANRSFVIVTPSAWLQRQVSQSILRDVPSYVIPSPVDTALFHPEDKEQVRARLGIPAGKKVVLFVASWINSIPHKGIGAFKEMLTVLLSKRQDMFAIVIGNLEGGSVLGTEFPGRETGWVQDSELLRSYYAASDVFVSPTMAENSSCTIMEAMASGTAVVAYATGGVPEQIVHGETGFLVAPGDTRELSESVLALLGDTEKTASFGAASARRALNNYSLELFVRKNLAVYADAMSRKGVTPDLVSA